MVSDSCEASTIFDFITSPNIFAIGSSIKDQMSLSYGKDSSL